MALDSLPVLSLDQDPVRLAGELGASFRGSGFALVRDHGIDPALIASGWELTRQFFALPEAEKRGYYAEGLAGARGYTPFGTEVAKGAVAARSQGVLARRPRPAAGPSARRLDAAQCLARPARTFSRDIRGAIP